MDEEVASAAHFTLILRVKVERARASRRTMHEILAISESVLVSRQHADIRDTLVNRVKESDARARIS